MDPATSRSADMTTTEYHAVSTRRAIRCWLVPYVRSRAYPRAFRPLLAYLFTDEKCNLDCHYCWAHHNRVPGMREEVARRAVEWLEETGCRALAIMGGEPLLRPGLICRIVEAAAARGFFVYLPTNGRLMSPALVDRLGAAGIATVNLAVDVINAMPALPKALAPIRSAFEYLVKRQHRYGYTVFLNINITRLNLQDVKELTEIAHDMNVATDYHLNEPPMQDQAHFGRAAGNETYLRHEDWSAVDDLLDHLADRNRAGYRMINSCQHFADMKRFMRGEVAPWVCRAGQSSVIIRTNGSLAPCFSYYADRHNWGRIGAPQFDLEDLDRRKQTCTAHCLSTCQHTLGYAYNASHAFHWLVRQARNGFRGVTRAVFDGSASGGLNGPRG